MWNEIRSRKLVGAQVQHYTKPSLKRSLMYRNALNAGRSNSMKDWRNISNETSWIWRTINIMIQTATTRGKESKDIVLKHIRANLIWVVFFRLKIFRKEGVTKIIPLPVILRTDHWVFIQLGRGKVFICLWNFLQKRNFRWSCYHVNDAATIYKTKGNILENHVIAKDDVILNFLERTPYIK